MCKINDNKTTASPTHSKHIRRIRTIKRGHPLPTLHTLLPLSSCGFRWRWTTSTNTCSRGWCWLLSMVHHSGARCICWSSYRRAGWRGGGREGCACCGFACVRYSVNHSVKEKGGGGFRASYDREACGSIRARDGFKRLVLAALVGIVRAKESNDPL